MTDSRWNISRRSFIASASVGAVSAVMVNAAAIGAAPKPAAKYRRYKVASPQGQKALESYAKGVEAMLKLPPSDPHNWFRNAFIHFMDCPHGNWWFYVWHRGYLGYFEQTIRKLSGDPTFALFSNKLSTPFQIQISLGRWKFSLFPREREQELQSDGLDGKWDDG